MMLDVQQDYFELFGLPARFSLDGEQLSRAYRDLQAIVHPDRFVNAAESERRVSMQKATHANEAYRTLKDPVLRAVYLLRRRGIDPGLESNTAMPAAFLTEQMEWREAIEAASESADSRGLDRLSARLGSELNRMYARVGQQIDERGDFEGAAETVRKLMFLEKVGAEIDDAMESLDG